MSALRHLARRVRVSDLDTATASPGTAVSEAFPVHYATWADLRAMHAEHGSCRDEPLGLEGCARCHSRERDLWVERYPTFIQARRRARSLIFGGIATHAYVGQQRILDDGSGEPRAEDRVIESYDSLVVFAPPD